MDLTHFNANGRARMVNVGAKQPTERIAIARGCVRLQPETVQLILAGDMKKGDVLGVAQVAGIMGAKKTSDLIPMCHLLNLTGVDLKFKVNDIEKIIIIEAEVSTFGKTGVEMEALMAVTTAALTIYDMCKAVDKTITIEKVELIYKSGGQSGTYQREGVCIHG